ncbi:MAG: hypothetical protein AAFX87_29400 [Bacteroidota bacterium]
MKINFALAALLCLSIVSASGQKKNFEGYVLKQSKGDTLTGLIRFKGRKSNSYGVTLKPSQRFAPSSTEGYGIYNSKHFESRVIKNDTVFVEVVFRGKIDLLYFKDRNGDDRYFLENDSFGVKELSVKDQFYAKSVYEVKKKNLVFRGILKNFIQDTPQLYADVDRAKLNKRSLIKLLQRYHEIHDYSYQIYDRFNLKKTWAFGVSLGYLVVANEVPPLNASYTNGATPNLQVFIEKNLSELTQKWHFRTGFSIYKSDLVSDMITPPGDSFFQPFFNSEQNDLGGSIRGVELDFSRTVIDIPMLLDYGIAVGKVNPHLFFGLNHSMTVSQRNNGTLLLEDVFGITFIDRRPITVYTNEREIQDPGRTFGYNLGSIVGSGLTVDLDNGHRIGINYRYNYQFPRGNFSTSAHGLSLEYKF